MVVKGGKEMFKKKSRQTSSKNKPTVEDGENHKDEKASKVHNESLFPISSKDYLEAMLLLVWKRSLI